MNNKKLALIGIGVTVVLVAGVVADDYFHKHQKAVAIQTEKTAAKPVPMTDSVDSKTKSEIFDVLKKVETPLSNGNIHTNLDVVDKQLEKEGLVTPYFVNQQTPTNQNWTKAVAQGVTKATMSDFKLLKIQGVQGNSTMMVAYTSETDSYTQNGKTTAYPNQELVWELVLSNDGTHWEVNDLNSPQ